MPGGGGSIFGCMYESVEQDVVSDLVHALIASPSSGNHRRALNCSPLGFPRVWQSEGQSFEADREIVRGPGAQRYP